MMRLVEGAVFLGLAGALHVLALGLAGPIGGGAAGGDGGHAEITLDATPESLGALVERWEMPPATGAAPGPGPAPSAPVPDAAPVATTPADPGPPAAMPPPRRPLPAAVADAPPRIDPRLPAPVTIPGEAPQPLQRPPSPESLAVPGATQDPGVVRNETARITPPAPDRAAAPDRRPPSPMANALPQIDGAPPRREARPDVFADASDLAPSRSARPTLRPADDFPDLAHARATPPPASPARPAQQARGPRQSGADAAPAAQARPAPPGPTAAERRQAQAEWGAQIRNRVARAQRYPRGTTATGTVTLQLKVSRNGGLSGVSVIASSGHPALDQAALRAARAARLPHAPTALDQPSYAFNLPLRFARR